MKGGAIHVQGAADGTEWSKASSTGGRQLMPAKAGLQDSTVLRDALWHRLPAQQPPTQHDCQLGAPSAPHLRHFKVKDAGGFHDVFFLPGVEGAWDEEHVHLCEEERTRRHHE